MLGLALLKVPVTDLERSVAFYEHALGLIPAFVAKEYGWAQMDGIDTAFALYEVGKGGGSGQPGTEVGFHLSHSNLDELHAQAVQYDAGAQIATNADDTRSLDLHDPDGTLIRVMERSNDG